MLDHFRRARRRLGLKLVTEPTHVANGPRDQVLTHEIERRNFIPLGRQRLMDLERLIARLDKREIVGPIEEVAAIDRRGAIQRQTVHLHHRARRIRFDHEPPFDAAGHPQHDREPAADYQRASFHGTHLPGPNWLRESARGRTYPGQAGLRQGELLLSRWEWSAIFRRRGEDSSQGS